MLSTFIIEELIFGALTDAQLVTKPDDIPFSVPAEFRLYNFNPGDFRETGYVPGDGIYIFVKDSDLDPSTGGPGSQTHRPQLCIDFYSSRGAASDGAGGYNYSSIECTIAMKEAVAAIYAAVMHQSFRDTIKGRMKARIEAGTAPASATPMFRISVFKNHGILRLDESDLSTAIAQLIFVMSSTEISSEVTGTALLKIEDYKEFYRDKDADPEPPDGWPFEE